MFSWCIANNGLKYFCSWTDWLAELKRFCSILGARTFKLEKNIFGQGYKMFAVTPILWNCESNFYRDTQERSVSEYNISKAPDNTWLIQNDTTKMALHQKQKKRETESLEQKCHTGTVKHRVVDGYLNIVLLAPNLNYNLDTVSAAHNVCGPTYHHWLEAQLFSDFIWCFLGTSSFKNVIFGHFTLLQILQPNEWIITF